MQVNVLEMSFRDYYRHQKQDLKMWNSERLLPYPRYFVLGYMLPGKEGATIKVLRWAPGRTKRIFHEIGHTLGLEHVNTLGYLMFPMMLGRGWNL